MELFIISSKEIYLLTIVGALFIIQLIYYFYLYNRIIRRSRALKREEIHFAKDNPPISVVVYAHDAYNDLQQNLISILEQDYPEFEVIVINDGKNIESEDLLTLMESHYGNLYHSFIPTSSHYLDKKKLAVCLGVKAAKYNWIVLTDANCVPASKQWLRTMARNFTSRTQIVLGYSGYSNNKEAIKGWLHKQIAIDNLFTSMRYLCFALLGKPYMGIGRNLAYRKELFFEQKGFNIHLNLSGGYDDLFINQVANRNNCRVECSPEAVVRFQPVTRMKEWHEEKISYASTAQYYKGSQRFFLGFETCSRLLFYLAGLATLVYCAILQYWLSVGISIFLLLTRFIVQTSVFRLTAKALGESSCYCASIPLFNFLQPLRSIYWKWKGLNKK